MSIIETQALSYTYGAKTPFEKDAVREVSLEINEGEIVGIIGHTGSGKSTLVQMLNGLIRPTSGKVLLDGKDIWEEPKKIRSVRFKVGMVFQYPEYQLFEDTVKKDIAFGPKNKGLSDDEIEKSVIQAAQFAGLREDLLMKSPFDLSGGEKRRAAIAGVVAMDPDVLILDEPTAGLDPQGKEDLLAQIKQYHKIRGNTVLLVSHSMEDIAKTADRVLVMNKGTKFAFDSTESIFAKGSELIEMGLKVPQITSIMNRLRSMGYPVKKGVLTTRQAFNEISKLL